MERHLVISDRAHSMADLKLMSNNSDGIVLPTQRDTLRLRVKEMDKSKYQYLLSHIIPIQTFNYFTFNLQIIMLNGVINGSMYLDQT